MTDPTGEVPRGEIHGTLIDTRTWRASFMTGACLGGFICAILAAVTVLGMTLN